MVGRHAEEDEVICGAGAYRRGLWEAFEATQIEKLRRQAEEGL